MNRVLQVLPEGGLFGTHAIFRNSKTLLRSEVFGCRYLSTSVPSSVLSGNAADVPIHADMSEFCDVIHQRHLNQAVEPGQKEKGHTNIAAGDVIQLQGTAL